MQWIINMKLYLFLYYNYKLIIMTPEELEELIQLRDLLLKYRDYNTIKVDAFARAAVTNVYRLVRRDIDPDNKSTRI